MIAVPQDTGGFRIQVRPVTTAYSIEGRIESLDATEDQWTVIDSGLNAGDLVVVSLLDQISHGLIVEVVGHKSTVQETEPATELDTEAQP